MRCLFVLAWWLIAATAPGLAAERGEVSIAAFYGLWVGSGLSATSMSQAFQMTQRDFDVEIRPDADGFRLTWTTVKRQKGDPKNPQVSRSQASLTFRPAGGRNVWRSVENGDLLNGKPYAWAR